MNTSKATILCFLLVSTFITGCDNRSDDFRKEALRALIKSNEIQREAHLTNDAELFTSQIADTMTGASMGNIQYSINQDIVERFDQYFSMVKYTSWDDVQAPAIYLSEDATLASVYVQKLLDIQHKTEDGNFGDHQYSVFSWNSDYKKIDDEWKIIGATSTNRSLTEEEAFDLPIHLSKEYAIIPEVDLIPEGVAYDNNTGTMYLSSTYKQKILAINPDGTYNDFKTEQENGLWSTLGMEVDEKNNLLWVVSFNGHEVLPMKYPDPKAKWSSRLYAYELPGGELKGMYEPDVEGQVAFNDLCISSNGDVYSSESLNNKVYKFSLDNQIFESLPINDSLFIFPNGLSFSSDDRYLYIASQLGIFQYDTNQKSGDFLTKHDGIDDTRLDGLAYYNGTLIGNQSYRKRIIEFKLDESNQTIVSQRILEANHPDFDQPSTGEITNDGFFIYLANAQMRSGFENGVLRELNQLDTIKILKVKLYSNEL